MHFMVLVPTDLARSVSPLLLRCSVGSPVPS